MTNEIYVSFLLFILSWTSSIAQEYVPTLEEGAAWNEVFYFEGAINFEYSVGRDTLINDKNYKKFLDEYDSSIQFLREDTQAKKIYMQNFSVPNEELLLYDYSLGVGDIFENLRLDSIRNELVLPNENDQIASSSINQRVFYFTDIGNSLGTVIIWVEGIGSLTHSFLRDGQSDTFFLCHFDKDGILDLSLRPDFAPDLEGCIITSTQSVKSNFIDFELSPNPSNEVININFKEDLKNAKFVISDYTGKKVQSSFFTGEKNQIDIQKLHPGMYILQIFEEGILIGVKNFVKM